MAASHKKSTNHEAAARVSASADPYDLDDIIDRLHIGTLKRERLKARRSIVVDADVPVLSYEETEALEKSETYSVTSEESYKDKKVKRRLSGSSRDSGSGSLGNDPSPRPREKTVKPKPKLRDQEIQTTLGKGQQYRLQDVYAAEEGVLSHPKHLDDKSQNQKSSKLSKIFKPAKKSDENQNTVGGGEQYPTLPQTFIVKYMGNKPSKGYGGAKYIQGPVEEVVEMVNQMPRGSDLPLVKLEVSEEGLHMVPHKRNKVKLFESVSIPIKFISYGSQDQNFPRIFCFIMVREMSSRSKKLDCHVYACDSSKSARKLASCLAFAFHLYQEKMEGQPAQYTTPITNAVSDLSDDAMSSYDA